MAAAAGSSTAGVPASDRQPAAANDAAASPPGRRSRAGAEAARYGVLRRLAPALKHDMVVNLQAISMMAEVLNAKLERGSPAPAEFHSSIAKLNRLAREAVANCLKVASWLEPGEDEGVRLAEGVDDCLSLLASNFNFRGFVVHKDVRDSSFQVSRVVLRHLLVASLITLTDAAQGPCEVHVKAEVVSGMAEVSVRISPRQDGFEGLPFEANYRELEWQDVQALALAESVELVRGNDHIMMRMPRAIATAPLQIAPV
jgi:C4-dicarboxylate-specific signal transduction histidine kinase